MEALQQQFEETLSLWIQTCLEKGDDLEQLKESCLNEVNTNSTAATIRNLLIFTAQKRLPRGAVTGAEKRINAKAAELENVLEKNLKKKKKTYTLWIDFIEAKYDELTEVVRLRSESLASTVSMAKPSE